jgi:hypothetical protein
MHRFKSKPSEFPHYFLKERLWYHDNGSVARICVVQIEVLSVRVDNCSVVKEYMMTEYFASCNTKGWEAFI